MVTPPATYSVDSAQSALPAAYTVSRGIPRAFTKTISGSEIAIFDSELVNSNPELAKSGSEFAKFDPELATFNPEFPVSNPETGISNSELALSGPELVSSGAESYHLICIGRENGPLSWLASRPTDRDP
ncbi:MAG: hypothetical protein LBD71_06340 [Treponema sp.]|nr:hypothetical protein [Treponema sp.]